MRCDDRDISWLWIQIVSRDVLLDGHFQNFFLGMGCSPCILSDMLGIKDMFPDLKYGGHGEVSTHNRASSAGFTVLSMRGGQLVKTDPPVDAPSWRKT